MPTHEPHSTTLACVRPSHKVSSKRLPSVGHCTCDGPRLLCIQGPEEGCCIPQLPLPGYIQKQLHQLRAQQSHVLIAATKSTTTDGYLQLVRIAPSSTAPCDPRASAVSTCESCTSSCGCACKLTQDPLTPHCCPIKVGRGRQHLFCTALLVACRPLRVRPPIAAMLAD